MEDKEELQNSVFPNFTDACEWNEKQKD